MGVVAAVRAQMPGHALANPHPPRHDPTLRRKLRAGLPFSCPRCTPKDVLPHVLRKELSLRACSGVGAWVWLCAGVAGGGVKKLAERVKPGAAHALARSGWVREGLKAVAAGRRGGSGGWAGRARLCLAVAAAAAWWCEPAPVAQIELKAGTADRPGHPSNVRVLKWGRGPPSRTCGGIRSTLGPQGLRLAGVDRGPGGAAC